MTTRKIPTFQGVSAIFMMISLMGTEYSMIRKRRIVDRLEPRAPTPARLRLAPTPAETIDDQPASSIESMSPIELMILESRVEIEDPTVTTAEHAALAQHLSQD